MKSAMPRSRRSANSRNLDGRRSKGGGREATSFLRLARGPGDGPVVARAKSDVYGVLAVGVHDVDVGLVVDAVAEGDALAVGGEARRPVGGWVVGEVFGREGNARSGESNVESDMLIGNEHLEIE